MIYLQVLLDDDRLRRLEERAKATGASVGSRLVDPADRDAVAELAR